MVTPAAAPQQFCVRWNSYQSNLQNAFPKLLNSEHFVDVTLACENEMLKCHKVVLSACSTYFEKLLLDNPCQHPIIFMKDMKFNEMQSLVEFMYKGEVNVTQDDLPSLLKSAEALQIRGLCGSDQLLSQHQKQQQQQDNCKPSKVLNNSTNLTNNDPLSTPTTANLNNVKNYDIKGEELTKLVKQQQLIESSESGNNPSSSECDSNDGLMMMMGNQSNTDRIKDECFDDASFYEGDTRLMDTTDYEDGIGANEQCNSSLDLNKTGNDFAIANVSCQYDGGSPDGSASSRRIRRSDEELRRAAECITRGQTFQTVSDQFNIPISTIRFYMARKGILPRRKRGRACAASSNGGGGGHMASSSSFNSSPGNTSPIGPPYHIVHYKLPALGVSKLK